MNSTKKILSICAVLFSSCHNGSKTSQTKDAVVYGTHAHAYVFLPAERDNLVKLRKCPELATTTIRSELPKKCPEATSETKTFSVDALKIFFFNQVKSPSREFQSQLDDKGMRQLNEYRDQLKETDSAETVRIEEEIRKLKVAIVALKQTLASSIDRKRALENYAIQAGGETYLGKERYEELVTVRSKIAALDSDIVSQESRLARLTQSLPGYASLFVDGRILIAAANDADSFLIVRPSEKDVLAVLTEMAFVKLPIATLDAQ